ncbi:MAG: ATP-dependent Clp protease proteolytic subunit [Bacilli bacterium]|nr:ATP-dependent Clp protease proteolytic subunit [Bacilli bacterium]
MQEIENLIEIPTPLENLQLPSPELLNFYKDVKNRCIWICDVDDSLLEYIKLIIMWNREDKGKSVEERVPIRLLLHSYGGSADVCFALISLIKISKTPIYTINMGMAASAGALIFIAGHKRFAMDGSSCLIHQGSNSVEGTAEQILAATKAYNDLLDKMKDFILKNTKITNATYNKKKKDDWTILSDKFIEYGIADEIISDIDALL